jgi:hypothetical protein
MFSRQLTTPRDCIELRACFSFVTSRIKEGPSANTLNDLPLELDAAALQLGFDGVNLSREANPCVRSGPGARIIGWRSSQPRPVLDASNR